MNGCACCLPGKTGSDNIYDVEFMLSRFADSFTCAFVVRNESNIAPRLFTLLLGLVIIPSMSSYRLLSLAHGWVMPWIEYSVLSPC